MLKQKSHKCVDLRGRICRVNNFFFQSLSCFLYKAKDFSAPFHSLHSHVRRANLTLVYGENDVGFEVLVTMKIAK
jgi:hypothetical protein